ncbi:MFS transporter [Actinocorallia longicatena]|uniref:MFS-type drug efflux transporter P55 n=1 Tax=Actinocorallia longicatena TaxID=111803 RepID=A0ABP6QM97_9ACTN
MPAVNRRAAIWVGGTVVLLASLDAYVIVTLLTTMVQDVHVPINRPERITPVVTGFLLGYVAAMPLLGQLSDRLGRRTVLHACLAAFALGSALTAWADSLDLLVAGRVVQGIAGGALLPITMALAGDLWSERRRPLVLGAVGAAQEMGSVLGPLYGAALAGLVGWRGIFWINVPLAVVAMVAVHFSVPSARPGRPGRIDGVGGVLLALGLGLLVYGSYNPAPEESALPSWGVPCLVAGAVVLVAFGIWEKRSRAKLLDLTGVRKRPVFTVLAVSLLSGAALMVTLVDVELVNQTLGNDSTESALVLARFLAALAVAAVIGGVLAHRYGDRWPLTAGMALAAAGYLMISRWPFDAAAAAYGPLPRMDVDLALAGFGLGLVIAPVSSAVLRLVPSGQHGVASAAVVVSRMMGMLLGIAAIGGFGFHRFQSLIIERKLEPPFPLGMKAAEFKRALDAYQLEINRVLHTEYREIFLITAALCLLGAVLAATLNETVKPEISDESTHGAAEVSHRS